MPAITPPQTTAPLRRRLFCMVYEAMLLFGIIFSADLLLLLLSHSLPALGSRLTQQIWLFLVVGAYFTYCWSRSGQTLAMQTWRIRVSDLGGGKLPLAKALVRYMLAWMWFLPALAIAYEFELHTWSMVAAIALGMLAWALTAYLDTDRQFLHDRLAKTRLNEVPGNSKADLNA